MSKSIKFDKVYHVGHLSVGSIRPIVRFSYEGNGLSVSQNPEAWIKIAKLGGSGIYVLRKNSGGVFFNAYGSERSKALDWCIDNGYLVKKKRFKANLGYDEDLGGESYSTHNSKSKALAESDDVTEFKGYVFGERGKKYWKSSFSSKIDDGMAEDFSVLFYAEAKGYDGVWWSEKLDVSSLSAPRGCIFQHKIKEWVIEEASPNNCDFEEGDDFLDDSGDE